MEQTDRKMVTSDNRPLRQSPIYNKAYRFRNLYCRITIKFAIFASIWRIPKSWKTDRREHAP